MIPFRMGLGFFKECICVVQLALNIALWCTYHVFLQAPPFVCPGKHGVSYRFTAGICCEHLRIQAEGSNAGHSLYLLIGDLQRLATFTVIDSHVCREIDLDV